MSRLKAPEFQARNTVTGDLLTSSGRPIIGSRSVVAALAERHVALGAAGAFVVEPVPAPDLMAAPKESPR